MTKPKVVDPEWERLRRSHPRFPGVAQCASMLRSGNIQGSRVDIICGELEAHAATNLDELIAEVRNPDNDGRVRAILVAALAEASVLTAVPFLIECLDDYEASVRYWAAQGLERVGTKEARTALWVARSTGRHNLPAHGRAAEEGES